MIVLWMWACGWMGPPEPVRSVPTEPKVDLTGEGPIKATMVWSDLAEMFPEAPGMVRPLAELIPGSPAERVREVLSEARKPGARPLQEDELAGHPTLSTVLRHGSTDVPVTVVLDEAGERLESVDLAIEWPSASAVLGDRWGTPPGPPIQEGRAIARWSAGSWVVELHRYRDGRGIVHFEPAPG